jgi:hypothetical protein
MPEQRRRFEQAQSLKQRLLDRVNSLREPVKLMPPDFDRETLPYMREYQVYVLTTEGYILDQHILTCEDDDEAKAMAKVLADSNPVEIWIGLARLVRLEPMQ